MVCIARPRRSSGLVGRNLIAAREQLRIREAKGAHRVDAGLNYGLFLNDFAEGASWLRGARRRRSSRDADRL